MKPPDPKVKPFPTFPGTNVTALDPDAPFKPNRSLVSASPIHQLTSPDGAVAQTEPVTVKALVSVTTSAPVVSVTLRGPAVAAGSTFSTAVAEVAELMVKVDPEIGRAHV